MSKTEHLAVGFRAPLPKDRGGAGSTVVGQFPVTLGRGYELVPMATMGEASPGYSQVACQHLRFS